MTGLQKEYRICRDSINVRPTGVPAVEVVIDLVHKAFRASHGFCNEGMV